MGILSALFGHGQGNETKNVFPKENFSVLEGTHW